MTEKPLVSVIINCYNSEKYLFDTIMSVLHQSYDNWEIIFWDNCSTDNTSAIIHQMHDCRIKYYMAKENTALGMARNLALEKAAGKYICFLDSDDLWKKEFLEECISTLENNPQVGLVYTRYIHFDKTKEWLSRGLGEDCIVEINRFIRKYNVGMSAAMFRKATIGNTIRFDTRFSLIEDFDFFLKIAALSSVYYVDKPLMCYRHHGAQASNSEKWATEFSLMADSIQKDEEYKLLEPFRRRVLNLKGYYSIMNALDTGNHVLGFKIVCKQCLYDISVLRYFFPLLFGKESYLKIRKVIDAVK